MDVLFAHNPVGLENAGTRQDYGSPVGTLIKAVGRIPLKTWHACSICEMIGRKDTV